MNFILAIILGLAAAWLVNYLSDVLPTLRRLSRPICPHCGTTFPWQSYLLAKACPECKKPRSWRTYIVLTAGVVLSLILWTNPPAQFGYWVGLLVLVYFGVVLVIDLEHRLILHVVSLAGAIIGLLVGILAHGLEVTLAGGLAGLGIMLVVYLFGMLFTRYRARKLGTDDDEEAFGFGDVTLSGALGLMLGWPHIVTGLIIGIFAGALISVLLVVFLVATRRYESMNVFIAYGPYLVLGAALLLFFPQTIALWGAR